jgi:hypothetical protein
MSTLAIDPGARECAFAGFDDRRILGRSWFAVVPDCAFAPRDVVVVERMQLDERSYHVDLHGTFACMAAGLRAAGFAEGRGAKLVQLTPHEWKRSEQKPVQHARLWDGILTPEERAILGGEATRAVIERALEKGASCRWKITGAKCYPSTWKRHNELDAVALGLTYLGRMEKRS